MAPTSTFYPWKNEGTEAMNMRQSESLASKIKLKNLEASEMDLTYNSGDTER